MSTTIKLALLPDRFNYLARHYREDAINVLSREDNNGFVTFEITIRGPWDVLDIFHSGVSCGIDLSVPWKSK
jgi:hypothetical protein